jgi:hypothetical protein
VGSFYTRFFGVVYGNCGDFHYGLEEGTASVHQRFWRYKMAAIPRPPYSTDLAACDFLFSKTKLKPKGRRFDTIEDIQAQSQTVLDAVIEKTSRKRSKNGGRDGPVST